MIFFGKDTLAKMTQISESFGYKANPYWEKWGRGRPSKEALEKRRKSDQWKKTTRRRLEIIHL